MPKLAKGEVEEDVWADGAAKLKEGVFGLSSVGSSFALLASAALGKLNLGGADAFTEDADFGTSSPAPGDLVSTAIGFLGGTKGVGESGASLEGVASEASVVLGVASSSFFSCPPSTDCASSLLTSS